MDYLRGHKIEEINDEWFYCDTGEPTVGNERACGYCGLDNTPEGHDGCLGTLPGVMNACCGHGQEEEAYVQFRGAVSTIEVSGKKAGKIMRCLK